MSASFPTSTGKGESQDWREGLTLDLEYFEFPNDVITGMLTGRGNTIAKSPGSAYIVDDKNKISLFLRILMVQDHTVTLNRKFVQGKDHLDTLYDMVTDLAERVDRGLHPLTDQAYRVSPPPMESGLFSGFVSTQAQTHSQEDIVPLQADEI
ncbi:hypothetical protein TREMEDRAFT_62196 [Tremella mesenterica DSM 1558]|uniref:uncharacterized protein n=1 Tax=Tremella mesenterica (strain ATCC 24925 / CBS 8224 / DSM 1558 / NBRC 9311 / NRRL Y-6157 / RJB 2259-6 / UBC 559-6) TaxID=578456 RepID=UPI0003F48E66|nr:uncharacterized protein TREMEDRAFT_62196 [Tremella mesenterica DSM 1558]EIW69333.1 hypothetical protein TREMEDRAFT_62196 [Tremella mesenterica DSM 1558]